MLWNMLAKAEEDRWGDGYQLDGRYLWIIMPTLILPRYYESVHSQLEALHFSLVTRLATFGVLVSWQCRTRKGLSQPEWASPSMVAPRSVQVLFVLYLIIAQSTTRIEHGQHWLACS